jgi:hypothetical protein
MLPKRKLVVDVLEAVLMDESIKNGRTKMGFK